MINSVGALVRLLPPYSPDLNPIELVFSKVKFFTKANYLVVQCTSIPRVVVSLAFNTVTQEDCIHYIQDMFKFITQLHYQLLWFKVQQCMYLVPLVGGQLFHEVNNNSVFLILTIS